MAGAGYTPDEIDAMPAQDAMALLRHWHKTPPAHEVLAAVYGVTPKPVADPADPSGIGALIARHPGGTVQS